VQPLELHECNRWNCMSATAGTVGTALVTGSTTGIGRAAALRLARDGWEVIVHGRDAGRGAEVVAAIEAEGGRARFVAADLTDTGEVRRLAEEAGEVDRIINFASWYGMIGNAGTVGYNITKEAVRSPTRTAAREWGRYAITVNVVAPTAKTGAADNIERADPEAMAAAAAAIPAGRLGDPHLDIAPAVLFLATDDARYITGQTLGVDGGLFPHA
jgi:NAD(P)-dependent dehydrogenase (short-subunit alcohol dehydrogenase family)